MIIPLFQVVIEDVSKPLIEASRKRKGSARKIVQEDFDYPPVAILAKRCARMATCIIEMFPEEPLFAWELFSNEIAKHAQEGRGDEMVKALSAIAADGNKRDELIRFVSFLFFGFHSLGNLTSTSDELWAFFYPV
jgi:hypothetical protein